ncbi:stalk domain-containing protein [Paenibacillus sp. y28]|uniref:stalk domain-containing protein n=1 Tax=Paenibacillus sp. y28 TaxID=3129110 RepID=UPI00301719AD
MKRLLMVCVLMLASIFGAASTASADEQPVRVYLQGKQMRFDVEPVNEKGTLLVQLRPLFEQLGMRVIWDEPAKKVRGEGGIWNVELQLQAKTAKVNGESVQLDAPARAINGVTMVPLRFAAESSGMQVKWDEEKQQVEITEGLNVALKTRQYGGASYDPANASFLKGKYSTTITGQDDKLYVYWWSEASYRSTTYMYNYVSILQNGIWLSTARQVTGFAKKKDVYYKQVHHGNKMYIRDDIGIRLVQVSDYGVASGEERYMVRSSTSSKDEILQIVHSGRKTGILFGTADLLGIYFDDGTAVSVKDQHRVLTTQTGSPNQLVYNADTKRLHLFNGKSIRQLEVQTGELVYDEKGKDFSISPVKDTLIAAPSYHDGKMFYAYRTPSSSRIRFVSIDDSLRIEEQLSNYYLDPDFLNPQLFVFQAQFQLVHLAEYQRRPALKAVLVTRN